jgi:hypothetical protein
LISFARQSRTPGSSACAELDDKVVSAGAQTDDQLVSGNRALMTLRRLEFDDHSCAGRRNPKCGTAHSKHGSAVYNKALTQGRQLTSGEIEYQSVRMLEPAHLRLHQLIEGDFHINAVSVLSNRYRINYASGSARSGTSGILGNCGGRSQAGQKKHERCC